MNRKLRLWRKNPTTGYWVYVRNVTEAEAEDWLRVYRADEPQTQFKVSKTKPS